MHWFYEKNMISHGKLMPSTGCVLQPSFVETDSKSPNFQL